jgi:predicted RNA-binding Zn-ribbon protein involved in translation (DUF1610 family)
MDKYQCTECKWEGVENQRKEVTVTSHHNTVYQDYACPECGNIFLVNVSEEEYITNWARTINPNDL